MMDIQNIKQRYGIIGNDHQLMMALNKAIQVAPTDLSILIMGESGVGKDIFPKLIHDNSLRKHQKRGVVAVNCGAIPEGTLESELFGHVKGAFTNAEKDRKGYFEEADGGTIFLDEVGELPLDVQVKLLRVLENGEILPVGSSVARKVDVRVVAATNVDLEDALRSGKFREDLYYRLNQISINIPPLRERKEDIPLLFRKFSSDVAEKYKMPPVFLTEDAKEYIKNYPWYGNVRELKNITEQISVVESERNISKTILESYLPYVPAEKLPALSLSAGGQSQVISDRELLLKALTMGQMITEMRNEINELRQVVTQLASGMPVQPIQTAQPQTPQYASHQIPSHLPHFAEPLRDGEESVEFQDGEVVDDEESLALEEREKIAINKALQRHGGNRRLAAQDLHISERTLYRKLREYGEL